MDPELRELLQAIENLSDEDLASARGRLQEEAARLAEEDTDEALQALEEVATLTDSVNTEIAARETAATEREEKRQELLNRINPPAEDEPVAETDPEQPADPETDEGADDPETPAPDGGDATTPEEEEAEEAAPTPEAVAAAARARSRSSRPPISAVARRSPRAPAREEERVDGQYVLTASADLPGIPSGSELQDMIKVAEAFIAKHRTFSRSGGGKASGVDEYLPVARLDYSERYPEDRRIDMDADPEQQEAVVAAIVDRPAAEWDSIVAAGGLCAPVTPAYDLEQIAGAQRPIRDSLPGFNATRGGIRYVRPPLFTDFSAGVVAWTVANDANPSNPATKPCVTVNCGATVEVLIEAITQCIEFGNLGARAWPEQVANALANLRAFQARYAERRLLNTIDTNSQEVTAEEILGTTRTVLAVIDRAVAGFRGRHRVPDEFPLRFMAPRWLRDNIRTDLARELPGSTDERLAMADAEIEAFFTSRRVIITWFHDSHIAGQDMSGAQAGNAQLLGWPDRVHTYLFHEGAHVFIDGGTLDLGLVRDSVLNETNDYRMFSETFENVAFRGMESLDLNIGICADGSTSAAIDINPCSTGS